ncbi:hypothetical protein F183_A33440 [Bryobacterales bacterium F-183]|nr:hypothetical protein F183_A33440 [Bryobacterales bacterium F-183]
MDNRFDLSYPYAIDGRARTEAVPYASHIRELIEQILFTAPGERVNRPDFGAGVARLVFEPNSDALAATLQFTIQGNLQQWLRDRIEIEAVQVVHDESKLRIAVSYRISRTDARHIATFEEDRP